MGTVVAKKLKEVDSWSNGLTVTEAGKMRDYGTSRVMVEENEGIHRTYFPESQQPPRGGRAAQAYQDLSMPTRERR